MKRVFLSSRTLSRALLLTGAVALTGCASVSLEQNLQRVNEKTATFAGAEVTLARSDEDRGARLKAARQLLSAPLGQKEAVQLAMLNSPSLQALLAQGWSESADAAQVGRIANPMLSFERMVAGDELELGRSISFGLLDVLTLPARQGVASRRMEQAQLRLSSDVVDVVTKVRQAWVDAVAAQQTLEYASQVKDAAEAGAELARRMQAAGSFNRLNRAREHAFYADAATRLALAQHQVTATREELVRQLGLDESQAEQLQLPQRLPGLPKQALEPKVVSSMAAKERLDVRLAQSALGAAAKAQGLGTVASFTDVELTLRANSKVDTASNSRSDPQGYEVGVRLPIFDWGGMQRDAWNARTLLAANALEATTRAAGSNLRQSYSAYRTAYDVARHYREEVIPLRKVISEENQLRYNGMLIGVFELMADARDQANTVMAAINSEKEFWLADAALQAAVMGRPTNSPLTAASSEPSGGGAGH